MKYLIKKTDITEIPLIVEEESVNRTAFDVPMIGRFKTNYGTDINENMLNILENFSCPEDMGSITPVPDLSQVSKNQLKNPTVGQFWYNSTRSRMFFWNGNEWISLIMRGKYAANWGTIQHGNYLPKPINEEGKIFDYSECIWNVSPASINGQIDMFNCNTNSNGLVTMQYRNINSNTLIDSIANYLIIGIEGNVNNGTYIPPYQVSPTPTATPVGTPASTPVPTVSGTPQATVGATPTRTPDVTPTMMPTPGVSPSGTPAITPTSTPQATPAVTPSSSLQIPLSSIVFTDSFWANSQVVAGACTGAGIGFQSNGGVGKTGLRSGGIDRWLAVGYNASDFEISFEGEWIDDPPRVNPKGFYHTPAGDNTMGASGEWYNMGAGVSFSAGGCGNNINVSLAISYAIRRVGGTEMVGGSIIVGGTAGNPI